MKTILIIVLLLATPPEMVARGRGAMPIRGQETTSKANTSLVLAGACFIVFLVVRTIRTTLGR